MRVKEFFYRREAPFMKHRSSHKRSVCKRVSKFARAAVVGAALLGVAATEFNSELPALDIINNASGIGNNALQSFSDSSGAYVPGAFDENSIEEVSLPAPSSRAVVVEAGDYRFPFVFPPGANAKGIASIDLLCSPDQGTTWYSYATVLADAKEKEFFFEAPKVGEYWFALMTSFKSGKRSFSSTRSLSFTQSAASFDDSADSFALADDLDEFALPLLEQSADSDSLTELDALEPPSFGFNDDELLIDNASYADEEPLLDATAPPSAAANATTTPWPGKFRNLSFAVGKGTGSLMITVRWFRPVDLDAQYDVDVRSLNIERGPSPTGPWTIVGEDLDVTQDGYSWTATADEMKPFYVRSVARDAQGNAWRDVTTEALDVNRPDVRSALGPVKTPVPFTDPDDDSDSDETAGSTKGSGSDDDTKLVRNTVSERDEASDEVEDPDVESASALKSPRRGDRLVSTVERSQERSAPPRTRPYIPPPTNPTEFQINPLFTRGFSVLFQSSRARTEPSTSRNRSIFTPPSRVKEPTYVRPAEHRPSLYQLEAERIERERKAYEERLRYNKEREMTAFQENPALMEGRMFYMDSNGNLTTTPLPEMQQALWHGGNMESQGWTQVDQNAQIGQTFANTSMTANDSGEPIYMPRDVEAYDSSARSGAAIWPNNAYPQASSPGSSPLNNRYSDAEGSVQQGSTTGGANGNQIPPQSFHTPSQFNASPYYFSNASATTMNDEYLFPPQPIVSQ